VSGAAPHEARQLQLARADSMRAGERDRTADLPFTRRPLCLLSYTGGDVLNASRSELGLRSAVDHELDGWLEPGAVGLIPGNNGGRYGRRVDDAVRH
jgi:hypothetical protein